MSLAPALRNTIIKEVEKVAPEAAEKFEIDEEEFKKFLKEWLTKQFSKPTKGARARPKGKDGKGRLTGYILFSTENRVAVQQDFPDYKLTEISKELGKMWREMTEDEKAVWNKKAAKRNESNGLGTTPKTPAPAAEKKPAPKKRVVKRIVKKKQPVVESSESE